MTGYTVHTGASKKFVNGWDRIFGNADAGSKNSKQSSKAESAATKKTDKKSAKKKS